MKRPRPRTWKRTLIMVLLLLTGGAIVNVAVAWGSVLWASWPEEWPEIAVDDPSWSVEVSPIWPREPDYSGAWRFPFGTKTLHAARLTDLNDDETETIWLYDSGIPMRCLRSVEVQESDGGCTVFVLEPVGGAIHAGLKPPASIFGTDIAETRRLPLFPLWPGFATNTIFYAALLWLLIFAPGKIRRFSRVMRHRCPACAYPVGTSPVCTECGHPLGKQT